MHIRNGSYNGNWASPSRGNMPSLRSKKMVSNTKDRPSKSTNTTKDPNSSATSTRSEIAMDSSMDPMNTTTSRRYLDMGQTDRGSTRRAGGRQCYQLQLRN